MNDFAVNEIMNRIRVVRKRMDYSYMITTDNIKKIPEPVQDRSIMSCSEQGIFILLMNEDTFKMYLRRGENIIIGEDQNKNQLRKEFRILIDRCGCSQSGSKWICNPIKCFPKLIRFLYPNGGFNLKSYMVEKKNLHHREMK